MFSAKWMVAFFALLCLAARPAASAPVNDACSAATPIFVGNTLEGYNIDATGSITSSCASGDTLDVWYSFAATYTGIARFNTCGSSFDTTLSAYTTCGGAQISGACNDDTCELQSLLDLSVTSGTTYLIRVAGFGGAVGTFTINVISLVTASVPNVVGMAQASAQTAITTAGFAVGTVSQSYSSTVAAGNVISQSPVGGTSAYLGSAVNLVVSLGTNPVSAAVPNVVGMTREAAQVAIVTAGFIVGSVTEGYSDTVIAGNVMSQNPVGGTTVSLASAVNIVVSRYHAPEALAPVALDWVVSFGGHESERPEALAVDGAGNTYITGWFDGTTDLQPGPGETPYVANDGADVFMVKLNPAGGLVYGRAIGSDTGNFGHAVAADASGNGYFAGDYTGTMDLDPGPGNVPVMGTVYSLKLNPTGAYVLSGTVGPGQQNIARGIAADAAGNIFTVGEFQNTHDFDPGSGSFPLTAAGAMDGFVQILDPTGKLDAAWRLGGTGFDQVSAIFVDAQSNLYLTGYFDGTVDFNPSPSVTTNLVSAGGFSDIFVAKYDAANTLVYAKRFGGTGADRGYGIAVDAAGVAYVTGTFENTADFDGVNLVSSFRDVFILKLNSTGSRVFVKQIEVGNVNGIVLDSSGNSYIGGGFCCGSEDFDPGPGQFVLNSSDGDRGQYVLKLDSSGNFVYAFSTPGIVSAGIGIDADRNIYTMGYFWNTETFGWLGHQQSITTASSGNVDVWVAKFNQLPDLTCDGSLNSCPNFETEGLAYYGSAWNTKDDDSNGIRDRWEYEMLRTILCGSGHALTDDAVCVYESNLARFQQETNYALVNGQEDLIVGALSMNQGAQDYALTLLSNQSTPLFQTYDIIHYASARSASEPFGAEGDLDNDGVTNGQEAANVLAQGGTMLGFAAAAVDTSLDGTEREGGDDVYVDLAESNAGIQLGTQAYPFGRFVDATMWVLSGGTVFIDGTSSDVTSNWIGQVTRPMTIKASPVGTVRLGAP